MGARARLLGLEAGDQGNVRSYRTPHGLCATAHPLRSRVANTGYFRVTLRRDGKRVYRHVHRLVACAFLGPGVPGQEVAHNNGNPLDCRLANLRWATPVENAADKQAHGTQPKGETHHGAKLTEAAVLNIRARRRAGELGADIARAYGVDPSVVYRISKGRLWAHVAAEAA